MEVDRLESFKAKSSNIVLSVKRDMRTQYPDLVALGNVVQNKEHQYTCFEYHNVTIKQKTTKWTE